MPLTGGAADKFGNRFEGRWTVFMMADVMDERADALRLEPPGEEGAGVEFWLRRSTSQEYHQVKRQHGAEGRWTIGSLGEKGTLLHFFYKLGDPAAQCVFVSTHSAYQLEELADRARRAASWQEYEREFLKTGKSKTSFDELRNYWAKCGETEAYDRLKRVFVRNVDEETLRVMVESRLAQLVEGQPPQVVAAILAQYALDQVHHELTAIDLWRHLGQQACRRREWGKDPHVLAAVEAQNNRYLGLLRDDAISGTLIPRAEAQLVIDKLSSTDRKSSVMLAGEAGVGKSSVTPQVIGQLLGLGWAVLAFRVDRMEPQPTPDHVGERLNLPGSPAHILASVAKGRDCALVIDQLDAVSLASGRNPQFFECISEIIKQASIYPGMRLILICRKFDIDNDYRLRRLLEENGIAEVVTIKRLSHEKVREVVTSLGLDPSKLSAKQLDLLSVPLHLNLLSEVAAGSQADVLDFETAKDLYDKFWELKRSRARDRLGREARWARVIDTLCDYMNESQVLSAPTSVFDDDDLDVDAKVMASEHVLSFDDGRYSFFHESFFDYAFARRFSARRQRLLPFLLEREQHLFRRAQVRQILLHEREQARPTYLEDLALLLTEDRVRFHLKSAVFALLGSLTEPTLEELDVIRPMLDDLRHPLTAEAWGLLHRSTHWFGLADSTGLVDAWLRDGDSERVNRAVLVLRTIQRSVPERVAELLEPFIGASEEWNQRIAFVMQWSDLSNSRRFLELFLRSVDEGVLDGVRGPIAINSDFWDLSYGLPEQHPDWAAEVVGHYYRRMLTLVRTDQQGDPEWQVAAHIFGSTRDEHGDYFLTVARNAPLVFVEQVLPFMFDVMELTARRRGEPPWTDTVWPWRNLGETYGIGDSLLNAMVEALSALAISDPTAFATFAKRLRESGFETAQFLLVRAYRANGEHFADEAIEYLLENPVRFKTGYIDSDHWATRLMLQTVTPYCSEVMLNKLEEALLKYYTESERSQGGHLAYGHAQFTLLEGIDPARQSERVRQRLAELRRKFNKQTVEEPMGMVVGFVQSPIEQGAAEKMTDEQWLKAIMRHNQDDGASKIVGRDFIGGAGELAGLMKELAKQEPVRFAELACRFPDEANVKYFAAVLRGVADAGIDPQLALRLCRRVHALPSRPLGRWIPPVIAKLAASTLPDEALDIVAWYATEDPDPEREMWRTDASGGRVFFNGSIDAAAINSVRGVAAEVIGRLIFHDKGRLAKLLSTVERMVADPSTTVRAAVASALMAVLKHDRDLAVELFTRLCGDDDALLRTEGVERFMGYALRTHFEALTPLLLRMIGSDSEEAQIAGARLACSMALLKEEARPAAETCLSGTEFHRSGAAQVFAANLPQARFRKFCEDKLGALFNDSSEKVRSAASRCFSKFENDELGEHVELISTFIGSEAFEHEHRSLFFALEKTTSKLPGATCSACEKFFDMSGAAAADVSTHAAAESFMATKLLIRVYGQHKTPDIQTRCLNLIDRLAQTKVLGLDEAISEYER
jgi:hypothetical protein